MGTLGGAGGSTYQERPVAGILRGDLKCTYSAAVSGPRLAYEHRILAHTDVDIIWAPGSEPYVTGPDPIPRTITLPRGMTCFAVRFRPGHAAAALGLPISELASWQGGLAELWGRPADLLADEMNGAATHRAGFGALLRTLAARLAEAPAPDPFVAPALQWLSGAHRAGVADLAETLGVTERHFRRRFTAAVGVGPKAFHAISRLRGFLALVGCQAPSERALDRLALEAGFADQSHLNREFRRLTGLAPLAHFADPRSWA